MCPQTKSRKSYYSYNKYTFSLDTCFIEDVDYDGGDIRGYSPRNVKTAFECQDLCKQHKDCKFFSVVKGWNPIFTTKKCHLKGGPETWRGKVPRSRTSGPKNC